MDSFDEYLHEKWLQEGFTEEQIERKLEWLHGILNEKEAKDGNS